MPDRFHRPVLERALGRGRPGARRRGHAACVSSSLSTTSSRSSGCSRRRSRKPTRTPATSRAIRPACARMAANTPMRAIWFVFALAEMGRDRRCLSLLLDAEPGQPRVRRGLGRASIASNPMSSPPTSMPATRQQRAGAAAGPGTPVRRAGSIGRRSRRSSASNGAGSRSHSGPNYPATGMATKPRSRCLARRSRFTSFATKRPRRSRLKSMVRKQSRRPSSQKLVPRPRSWSRYRRKINTLGCRSRVLPGARHRVLFTCAGSVRCVRQAPAQQVPPACCD